MGGEGRLVTFLQSMNTVHPTIKFTSEGSSAAALVLDVTVMLYNGILSMDLFTKPPIQNTSTSAIPRVTPAPVRRSVRDHNGTPRVNKRLPFVITYHQDLQISRRFFTGYIPYYSLLSALPRLFRKYQR